jgi:gas vesicle protein
MKSVKVLLGLLIGFASGALSVVVLAPQKVRRQYTEITNHKFNRA